MIVVVAVVVMDVGDDVGARVVAVIQLRNSE